MSSKDVCSVAVIAGRSLPHERANLKTRVRCALLAPGLVDSVAITDGAFGTDPVFRAEIHLPLTLNVNTYTHLSVLLRHNNYVRSMFEKALENLDAM